MAATAFGEVLEFQTAIGNTLTPGAGGSATFTSVEATPQFLDENGNNHPARAFAGGFFTTQFNFNTQFPLNNPTGEDGMLVGLTRDPFGGWFTDWMLQARSIGGDARINDVALSSTGEIVVAGTFQGDLFFELPQQAPPIILLEQVGGVPVSFVAIADASGTWLSAFLVEGMEVNSLALDVSGDIFVTGSPVLARRYNPVGVLLWSTPEPPDTISLRHIAAVPNTADPILYVLGSFNGNPGGGAHNQDVFVAQLDSNSGVLNWNTPIDSPGEEHPGGLGIGPLGGIRASLSSDSRFLTVGGRPIVDIPTFNARHSHLIFLAPDGTWTGDNLLGNSLGQGSTMETGDLAVDYAGNSYVSVSLSGPFSFEGVTHAGDLDAAVVSIDGAGTPIRFTDTTGTAVAFGTAVAVVDRNLQILVGELQGLGQENFDDTNPLQVEQESRAYFGAIERSANQQAYILTSVLQLPLVVMEERITELGGEVYRALDFPNEGIRIVAAYLTTEQRGGLGQLFTSVIDADLRQDGLVSDSGWALEALNSAPPTGTPTYSYTYPESCHQTALYLIDTAIDTSSGYFSANTNLTIGSSILVRGTGDPLYSSAFDHGTEMLSMIAGPTYGAAQGTPIDVISYDIYPDGETAKLSSLIEAIILANSDKGLNYPFDPAVYCIASSSTTPGISPPTLNAAIDCAIGSSVYATVLVSAGNTEGSPSAYTPSDQGAKSGVICVGAIDIANEQ
ncbi:MAG: hypothetical protein VCA34_03030, partial [Roseibacillus sp.]